MKKTLLLILLLSVGLNISSQEKEKPYEVIKNMPAFYQEIKKTLTWPMAWGNSPIQDFGEWRVAARNKLDSCLLPVPPAAQNYDLQIVAREQRNGYEALKVVFNLTAWSRIPAYFLIPDGKGPFPAVVMLHDHGAHFSIGKEKMVNCLM